MKKNLPTLILFTLIISSAWSQVPNGGFESWTNVLGMFEDPDGYVSDNVEGIPGSVSCEKSTDTHSGDFAVKLITKLNAEGDIQDGGIISASLDLVTFGLTIGFPYTERPNTFLGYYKHNPAVVGDSSVIYAEFTRGSVIAGDFELVGTATFSTIATVSEWTLFEADIFWLLAGNPDTAIIAGQASYGTLGSIFFLDDLAFDIEGIGVQFLNGDNNIIVYPNPANEIIHVATGTNIVNAYCVFTNLEGKLIETKKINSIEETISTEHLSEGIYFLQVFNSDGALLSSDKVIVTH